MNDLSRTLRDQSGVVTRAQLLTSGLSRHDVQALVRRRQLARFTPGVFVDHTGPLTRVQRRWAAVLACAPAALSHVSALAVEGVRPGDERQIHVAVDRQRRVAAPPGVVVHRLADLEARVSWHLRPPRLRIEDAVLLTASAAVDDLAAIAVLADACGAWLTTAERLSARLAALPRLPRRSWLAAVLDDVASGTCSVLEHGYLTRVERPHGLPRGERQAPAATGERAGWRDVLYESVRTVVELDGRLHHGSPEQRAVDLQRDLVSAARRSEETVRLGWQQVYGTPCATASLVGAVLVRRGWTGAVRRCGLCGGSAADMRSDPPRTGAS